MQYKQNNTELHFLLNSCHIFTKFWRVSHQKLVSFKSLFTIRLVESVNSLKIQFLSKKLKLFVTLEAKEQNFMCKIWKRMKITGLKWKPPKLKLLVQPKFLWKLYQSQVVSVFQRQSMMVSEFWFIYLPDYILNLWKFFRHFTDKPIGGACAD